MAYETGPAPSACFGPRSLLQGEAAAACVLMAAAAAALAMANSPFAPAYFGVLNTEAGGLSLLHWIQ